MNVQIATLIATLAGVAVVVWYSLETRWLRQETARLLREAKVQNEIALRPIIEFYFGYSEGGVSIGEPGLGVRNVGRGPAFNLWARPLEVDSESAISIRLPESLPADRSEGCLFVVKNILQELTPASATLSARAIKTVHSLPISLKVTYTNASGIGYFTTLVVRSASDGEKVEVVFGGSGCMEQDELEKI